MTNPNPTTTSINLSQTRASFAALLSALLAGLNSVFPGVDPFVVDGQTIPRATLVARIQAALDAIAAVKAARGALQSAVATQNAAIVDAQGLRAGIKRAALTKLGPQSPRLQDLGFTPDRPRTASTQTKAQAAVKAQATRLANGNVGKKTRSVSTLEASASTAATPAATPPATPSATPPKA
ncbi:MAG TPA: hypothetical protein VGG39_22415 [Polyangiaceae bacterium]|jgi:hypothetical protein